MAQIQLSKKNFFHNLEICSNHVGSKEKIAIVLKDNAYGHGLLEIAQMTNEFGIKNAVVQNYKEATQILHLFEHILILADTQIDTYSHTFHITINSLDDIDVLETNSKIHIKVDSGMHRNGIAPDELEEAILRASKRGLKICGVFTHFKSADEMGSELFWQKANFETIKKRACEICEKLNLPKIKFHCCNSSALFRINNSDKNFEFSDLYARVGIAAYGYIENESPLYIPDLKPVLSLHAKKITTRELKKGQRVGYGGKFVAPNDMKVSTYDIGYGDGFRRFPDDITYKTPDGHNMLGRVSMDNLSLDSDKEEVCLFSDVKELAKLHKTISYEILTSLNPNIQRVIV
jgi:alanine racemase